MWPFTKKRVKNNFKEEVKEEALEIDSDNEVMYRLQVSHGSCTGVFWRGNPKTGARPEGVVSDWPRNGAILKGKVHTVNNQKWLHISAMRQATRLPLSTNYDDLQPVKGGRWIPFDGGPFNGGKFLHEV